MAHVIVVFSDSVNNRDGVASMADEWAWVWSIDVMILDGEHRSTRKETWLSATLLSTFLTWAGPGIEPRPPWWETGLGNCVMYALDSGPRIEMYVSGRMKL